VTPNPPADQTLRKEQPQSAAEADASAPIRVRLPLYSVRVTYIFLGLIGLTFAAQLGFRALLGFDPIIEYGAKENFLIAHGQTWRLLSAVFIHANLLHILFNAYALYNLGQEIEAFYGPVRFTLLFLFAGLSGSVLSMLLNPHPAVGASGAIFGLIGAEGVFLYRNRQLLGERGRRGLQSMIGIAVLNLLIGLQGAIDNWAHLGGLLGGLALGWLIGPLWELKFESLSERAAQAATLEDRHPFTGARWLAVLVCLGALAALTGFTIFVRR
jgi:rhomboid protease GluP